MAFDAGTDNDLLRGLETKNRTLQDQMDRLTQKCAELREMVCAREKSNGSLELNFDALADRLGFDDCMVLRKAIDERWRASGAPGEKVRVKVRAA